MGTHMDVSTVFSRAPAGLEAPRVRVEVHFTDGAKHVADRVGAYWLLDEIALTQLYDKRVRAEGFQVWKLNVNTDMTADLTCEDGSDNVVYIKKIPFTDFPLEGVTLWFTDNTILLPSEY